MTVSLTTAELAKYIDATALKADTSEADVRRLVAESREAGVKSVCINPVWVPLVAAELAGSDVLTCTVIGFPLGANASEVKAFEARQAIDAGADEVDMVLDVAAARAGAAPGSSRTSAPWPRPRTRTAPQATAGRCSR